MTPFLSPYGNHIKSYPHCLCIDSMQIKQIFHSRPCRFRKMPSLVLQISLFPGLSWTIHLISFRYETESTGIDTGLKAVYNGGKGGI